MTNPFSSFSLAATLALVGCNNDESSASSADAKATKTEAASDAEAPPELGASDSPSTAVPAPDRRVAIAPGSRKPLIGHFAIAPIETLVNKTRAQLVPGPLASLVTTDLLRSRLIDNADDEGARKAIEHIDMSRPIICGFADPLQFDDWVGCVVGYEGGVDQLVTDTAEEYAIAPKDGHAAHLRSKKGADLYVDQRDGLLVMSADPKFYEGAGDALLALAKAPSGRDFEFVFYPGVMVELYGPIVRDELQQVATGTRTGSELRKRLEDLAWAEVQERLAKMEVDLDEDDISMVEGLLADLEAMTPEDAKEALEVLDELESHTIQIDAFGLGFELEAAGMVFGVWYDTVRGSALQAELLAGPKLDHEWVALLPESSLMLGASVDDEEEDEDEDDAADDDEGDFEDTIVEALAELYEEQTGNPRATIEPDLRAFFDAREELYGPRSGWSLFTDPAGPMALVVVRENQAGKSGREGWKRWAERLSAERILGAEGTKYVTWEHRAGAFEAGGVPVDRWSLHITPKVGEELKDELFVSAIGTYLVEHDGLGLHVDRVEKDGRTSFVLAPVGSEAFVRAALAAQSTASAPEGIRTILARGSHPLSLWGLDVEAVLDVVREVAGDEVSEALKDVSVGTDLADVYGVSYLRADGGAAELVISQRLIDQIKTAAMR